MRICYEAYALGIRVGRDAIKLNEFQYSEGAALWKDVKTGVVFGT